jgi:putative membrane protein
VVSVAAWDFVVSLLDRWPLVGLAVTVLLAVGVLLGLAMAIRELAALSRLRRVEGFRDEAVTARTAELVEARAFGRKLSRFYEARPDLAWGRSRFAERVDEVMDADAVLDLAEQELLVPLDQRALREVEAAARQVATVTALVPLALADVFVALVSSLRMVRHIAEIYGGRSGLLGSWRLTRAILAHLVATGAVAAGDDLLEPVLGGAVLSKLSRRFGEGVVNGALSARVGIAAMEVCRPMPFSEGRKPRAGAVIRRALTGLFSKDSE